MLFRLEDLHAAFGETLDRSRLLWGLRRRHLSYVEPQRYLRAGIDGEMRSQLLESASFDKSSHPGELPGSVLDLVRNTVDEDVMRAYGYQVA
jgi:hypothetical protein